jgi:hypothetical protein
MRIAKNCRFEHGHCESAPRGGFSLEEDRGPRGAGREVRFSYSLKIRFCAALALMLLCLAAPAAAEELGRLFFTPQQRQDLDRRRASNRAEEETPQIREGPLTLEGHVQRSSGRTATWINGVPQYDNHASGDPARVTVVPNQGEPGVRLKIGQTYERTSGTVVDGLAGGEVRIGKEPASAAARAKP